MWALIAGMGGLPAALVAAAEERPVICALDGMEPDALDVDIPFRIEKLGSVLQDLKARGVSEVCFAGAIRRPAVDPAQIDAATMPLVPVIQQALTSGDDGALRAMIGVFEHVGFTMRGAHEIAPDLLLDAGCPTQAQPDTLAQKDANRGADIVAAMDAVDVGQACVVLRGQAIGIETVFGTDWMLGALAARPDGTGGILYKAPKPGQDRRADLPTIGPDTVTAAARAGLSGIVIQAGGVIVLEQPDVIAQCDALGLFLWVREAGA